MFSELTNEKRQELESAFKVYDRDGDHFLNLSELRSAMRALALNPTEEELQQMMGEMEGDVKGKINREDFLTLMLRRLRSYNPEEELLDAFKVFDSDDNSKISVTELRDVMATLGEILTPEEIDEMVKEAAPDQNQKIDYREFVKLIVGDLTPPFKSNTSD